MKFSIKGLNSTYNEPTAEMQSVEDVNLRGNNLPRVFGFIDSFKIGAERKS